MSLDPDKPFPGRKPRPSRTLLRVNILLEGAQSTVDVAMDPSAIAWDRFFNSNYLRALLRTLVVHIFNGRRTVNHTCVSHRDGGI